MCSADTWEARVERAGHCCRYIRLYGMKFSKEDHLLLINLVLEIMTIPGLDFSLVQKFAQLLTTLLKLVTNFIICAVHWWSVFSYAYVVCLSVHVCLSVCLQKC